MKKINKILKVLKNTFYQEIRFSQNKKFHIPNPDYIYFEKQKKM